MPFHCDICMQCMKRTHAHTSVTYVRLSHLRKFYKHFNCLQRLRFQFISGQCNKQAAELRKCLCEICDSRSSGHE
jgi:hypothetical protein